ncbi:MAG: aspartate carbamoyltransferase [Ruminococcus sp.]|jgi:aspartate carbamoyltransferase catalytic subunit|nr:aspartate carbamoyltransferase [Ruminococcus sp.]
MNRFTHLIDLDDFPVSYIEKIVNLGADIALNTAKYSEYCKDKVLATLFYEPSTRTQMSFQTAMLRLGGTLIGFDNPETSSVAKGENLKDTTKVVSSYADIMVMRNPVEGSAKAAAISADCPIINAGDGGHLHPTQTLTDLLTIKLEKGELENLTIGVCGDLKYGRTTHSLCKTLSKFSGNRFVFISAPELAMPDYIKDICEFKEIYSLEDALPELDMLYMTRIQRERFTGTTMPQKYILTKEMLAAMKPDAIILHPLPRVDEIEIAVDDDPRAKYFLQAKYGVYVRMALIIEILKNEYPTKLLSGEFSDKICENEKCVTTKEKYLPQSFSRKGDTIFCDYCESLITQQQIP